MTKTLLTLTTALVLLCSQSGCRLLLEQAPEKQPIQAPPLKVTQKTAPVLPEEITAANAHSKARQLLEELETDGRE